MSESNFDLPGFQYGQDVFVSLGGVDVLGIINAITFVDKTVLYSVAIPKSGILPDFRQDPYFREVTENLAFDMEGDVQYILIPNLGMDVLRPASYPETDSNEE